MTQQRSISAPWRFLRRFTGRRIRPQSPAARTMRSYCKLCNGKGKPSPSRKKGESRWNVSGSFQQIFSFYSGISVSRTVMSSGVLHVSPRKATRYLRELEGGMCMKVKTQLKAGSYTWNHNQTLVCDRTQRQPLKVKTHVKVGGLVVKCFLFFLTLGLTSVLTSSSGEVTARNNKPKGNLGIIRNVVAKSMIPKTKYDNIVNIGCGWASGINLVGGLNWGCT